MRKLGAMFVLFTACVAGWAQEAPKAGPEQAKLKYFVGDWKSEGEVKPGPVGPGGKYTASEHGKMLGDFFVVIQSDGDFMGTPLNGAAVMSYDTKKSAYVYEEYNTMGEHTVSQGMVSGDDWVWKNEVAGPGGKMMQGRYTQHIVSPTSYTYKFEVSDDGTKWATVMEGKSTKM